MSPSAAAERLERALREPERGVLGLVDELLAVAAEREARLAWLDGHCEVTLSADDEEPRTFEVPIPRSVFRAALARLATLGRETLPDCGPYSGTTLITAPLSPAGDVMILFLNTPGQQSAMLMPSPLRAAPGKPVRAQHRGSKASPPSPLKRDSS